jgi:hypothetical protein
LRVAPYILPEGESGDIPLNLYLPRRLLEASEAARQSTAARAEAG